MENNKFSNIQKKKFMEIIDEELMIYIDDTLQKTKYISNSIKCIYISALWCPPGKVFLSKLLLAYEKLKSKGCLFDIVFVSMDRCFESYLEHCKQMPPCFILPFKDDKIQEIIQHIGVNGIPSLIILDEKDDLLTADGRFYLSEDPEAENFPWSDSQVRILNEQNLLLMDRYICLIAFTDGIIDHIDACKLFLNIASTNYYNLKKVSKSMLPVLLFFYEDNQSDEIADSIRSFVDIICTPPFIAIIDWFNKRCIALKEAKNFDLAIIEEIVNQFIECQG